MRAFLVSKNGKQLCIAGIHEGVFDVSIHWSGGRDFPLPNGEYMSLHIGGLESQLDTYVEWKKRLLKPGDKITIEIIDSDRVDPEPKRRKRKQSPIANTKEKQKKSSRSQTTGK